MSDERTKKVDPEPKHSVTAINSQSTVAADHKSQSNRRTVTATIDRLRQWVGTVSAWGSPFGASPVINSVLLPRLTLSPFQRVVECGI